MRRVLGSTTLRLTALLWVVGFFVVFVPAHNRGIVKLPGHDATMAAADGQARPFCPLCMLIPRDTPDGDRPPADAPVNCAICFLKAGLDLPPTVIEAPRFVVELDYLMGHFEVAEPPLLISQVTLYGRAPPVSA